MLSEAMSATEQKLLKEVFIREDRDGAPHFVYYNDEKYYLILSICEKYQIQYRTRPNCILITFEEMTRILPNMHVGTVATMAPPPSTPVPAEKNRAAHPLMQRFQPQEVKEVEEVKEAEEAVLVLKEKLNTQPPVEEPKLSSLFPIPTPSIKPAPITATIPPTPEAKPPSLDDLLEQLSNQRQHTANTKQQSQDSRRQSLEAREQALLSREQAVSERERAITAREEDVERRKAAASGRLAALETEEQRIAHLAQSFAQRRRVLEQQRAVVSALQNHIQQVLNNGFTEMVSLAG
ncbi:MAG: hypothetical protein ACK59C_06895 [Holosporales bacterium]|jgi:hypothetical protein